MPFLFIKRYKNKTNEFKNATKGLKSVKMYEKNCLNAYFCLPYISIFNEKNINLNATLYVS